MCVSRLLLNLLCVLTLLWAAPASAQSYPKLVFVKQPYADADNALAVDDAARVVGKLAAEQVLYIRWQVPEHDAAAVWQLALQSEAETPLEFSMLRPTAAEASTAPAVKSFGAAAITTEPELLWQGTELPEHWLLSDGTYLLRIKNTDSATEFQLLLEQAQQKRSLQYVKNEVVELSANTNLMYSSTLPQLTFEIPEPPANKAWSLQGFTEVGDDLEITLTTAAGAAISAQQQPWLAAEAITSAATLTLQTEAEQQSKRIWLQLAEVDQQAPPTTPEQIAAAPQAAARSFSESYADAELGEEREPNNRQEQATLLPLGQTAKGQLHHADDYDYYVFHNPAPSDFQISITAPAPTRLTVAISPVGNSTFQRWQVEGELSQRMRLAEGDYFLTVEGDLATTEAYQVRLEHRLPWAAGSTYQPARSRDFAGPLPPDGVLALPDGDLDEFEGWYVLPVHTEERTFSWQGAVHKSGYAYYTGLEFIRPNGESLYTRDYGFNSGSIEIPANEQVSIKVTFGPNAKPITFSDTIPSPAFTPQLDYRIKVPNQAVAAWADEGQRVAFSITVENLTAQTLVAPLEANVTHAQASIHGLSEQLELAANAAQTLTGELKLPAQLEADAAIAILVGAEKFAVSDQVSLVPSSSAPLQQPFSIDTEAPADLPLKLVAQWLYSVPNQQDLRQPFVSETPQTTALERAELVLYFAEQQRATLSSLQWLDHQEQEAAGIAEVTVFGSEHSAGPWAFIEHWDLQRDSAGAATLEFTEPPTVRYLRLVIERTTTATEEESMAWQLPKKIIAQRAATASSNTAETPASTTLNAAQWDHYLAEPGQQQNFSVTVPDGHNRIRLTLSESIHGRLQALLVDAQGEAIPLRWQRSSVGREAIAAELAPGSYQLQLVEPPRHVMVVWDGSLSVEHFQAPLYQALRRVAAELEDGVEVMQLLPIGGDLLLQDWADSNEQVLRALAHYDNRYTSSNIAQALSTASKTLEKVDGEKALFLITDGFSENHDEVDWRSLAAVQPRIFSIQLPVGMAISAAQETANERFMRAWSHVNGGHHSFADDQLEIARALFSGMRKLRSGTHFTAELATDYQAPLPPGSFTTRQGPQPVAAASALQFIFDASGSMLKAMAGGRRIDVAKRVAENVLTTELPAHLPVALRAFGHTEPHSCASELLVAAEQNNHPQVQSALQQIQAVNLARTPLAASLAAVADDLADYAGGKQLVVLLTDGEETCDGDIPAALAQLQAKGIALQLNIVGFQLDDDALEGEFARVAELSAGQYFASQDAAQLQSALALAIAPQWRLVDAQQREVANGRVGDPAQPIAAGDYTLVIDGYPQPQTHQVSVAAGENLMFEVNDEATP
ncbi:VWA domain-containing protein [Pseudidiomarina salilacus]|uniref:VWA domain-containing protein n=1 Tax=Pseudidiomarina salilacus TaxID=3384452 RepID=UPI003984CC21